MEELLNDIVQVEQQHMLDLGFEQVYIPSRDSVAHTSIFMSNDWQTCQKLLLIVASGTGIQPGIWSRSFVLESRKDSEKYNMGSMIPYLRTALSAGFGILIMNPSTNTVTINSEKVPIECSSTPEMHVEYVWGTFGARAKCDQVFITAYGRGGVLIKHLLQAYPLLGEKVRAIAFIESSDADNKSDSERVRRLLAARAINWRQSQEPPGTYLGSKLGCLTLSAGQPNEHKTSNTAWTISASMEYIFSFFQSAQDFDSDEEAFAMPNVQHVKVGTRLHEEDAEMVHCGDLDGTTCHTEDVSQCPTTTPCPSAAMSHKRGMMISSSMSTRDFEFLSIIGKGAYGKVFLVRKTAGRNSGRCYAMKVLRKQDMLLKKQEEHAIVEQRILKAIVHPYIVRLRYAFQNEYKLYLLMDYYSGGSLFTHLRARQRFTLKEARFYAAEIALALTHLHQMRIMYRDLKLENILMDSEGHIAITDFGLSKEDDKGYTFVGTAEYLAPELLCSQRTSTCYGKSVDWWSFGVLLYEMIAGQSPFWDQNRQEMFRKIIMKEPEFPSELFPEVITDLIKRLLVKSPNQRLGSGESGAMEILTHTWFEGMNWELLYSRNIVPPFIPNAFVDQDNASTQELLQYVPRALTHQDPIDSLPLPEHCSSVCTHGNMHFENFSYVGSDIIGSRRTSLFKDSELRMELGETG